MSCEVSFILWLEVRLYLFFLLQNFKLWKWYKSMRAVNDTMYGSKIFDIFRGKVQHLAKFHTEPGIKVFFLNKWLPNQIFNILSISFFIKYLFVKIKSQEVFRNFVRWIFLFHIKNCQRITYTARIEKKKTRKKILFSFLVQCVFLAQNIATNSLS